MWLKKQNFPKHKQDKLTDFFLYFSIEVLKLKRHKEIQNKLTQWEAMIFLFKMNFFRDHSTQKSTKTKTVFHTIPFKNFLPNEENKMSWNWAQRMRIDSSKSTKSINQRTQENHTRIFYRNGKHKK